MSIKFAGTGAYSIKDGKVYFSIEKISNTRKGGVSGTLTISLLSLDYYYTGGPSEGKTYSTVAKFKLDPIEGGHSYTNVKKTIPAQNYKERNYSMFLIEEYSQDSDVMRDHMIFK